MMLKLSIVGVAFFVGVGAWQLSHWLVVGMVAAGLTCWGRAEYFGEELK